ncbi:hypothetical protein DJ031_00165 [bacterium endosymbiont of Escarpia laminata]|nr:MAG: hypothetical protein DJ031_00165 [bacterium endosymbiont of Escarpia laminata]
MATSNNEEMLLSELEQVSDGTYAFTRPLTLVTCALSPEYVCYPACKICNRKVLLETTKGGHHNVSICSVHGRQKGTAVYKYATGLLFADHKGNEVWATGFDQLVQEVVGGMTASDYMSLKSGDERYQSLNVLRGKQARVTIRKTTKGDYRNYTVIALEIIHS